MREALARGQAAVGAVQPCRQPAPGPGAAARPIRPAVAVQPARAVPPAGPLHRVAQRAAAPPEERTGHIAFNDRTPELMRAGVYFAGGITLHHKISQANIKTLTSLFKRALREGTPEEKAAAQAFLDAAKAVSLAPGGEHFHVFNNMPLNLEAGPQERLENPGDLFDPNTMPGEAREVAAASAAAAAAAPPPLSRQLTPRSRELSEIDRIIRSPGPITAAQWRQMTEALTRASGHHSSMDEAVRFSRGEQWEFVDESGKWRRKLTEEGRRAYEASPAADQARRRQVREEESAKREAARQDRLAEIRAETADRKRVEEQIAGLTRKVEKYLQHPGVTSWRALSDKLTAVLGIVGKDKEALQRKIERNRKPAAHRGQAARSEADLQTMIAEIEKLNSLLTPSSAAARPW